MDFAEERTDSRAFSRLSHAMPCAIMMRECPRAYSGPLKLSQFDGKNWTEIDDDLEYIGDAFRTLPYYELPNSEQAARLVEVEVDLSKAGLTGWNFAGLNAPVAE